MNTEQIVALLLQLLPLADRMTQLLDAIKTNAPDAWNQATSAYNQGVQTWDDAAETEQAQTVQDSEGPKSSPETDADEPTTSESDADSTEHEKQLADALAAQTRGHKVGP